MKNPKKTLCAIKSEPKRFEIVGNSSLGGKRIDKKTKTVSPFKKHLDFVEKHRKLFNEASFDTGDETSNFRDSLRTYHHLDLKRLHSDTYQIKRTETQLQNKFSSKTKSVLTLKEQKAVQKRFVKKFPKSRLTKKKKASVAVEVIHPPPAEGTHRNQESDVEREFDGDIFYSPGSFKSNKTHSESEITLVPDSVRSKKNSRSASVSPKVKNEADSRITSDSLDEKTPEKLSDVWEYNFETHTRHSSYSGGSSHSDTNSEKNTVKTQKLLGEKSIEEDLAKMAEGGATSTEEEDMKYQPEAHAAVLDELDAAEKKAKETAAAIQVIKQRVTELLKTEKCTEAEARELEQKNKELKQLMEVLDMCTKRINFLLGQTNLFESLVPKQKAKLTEDELPRLLICGLTESNIPKLIICPGEAAKKEPCEKDKGDQSPQMGTKSNIPMAMIPQFTKRLSDSYYMQERLAQENAGLEGARYQLQTDVLNKDQMIDCLQRKLQTIQNEMKMMCMENCRLNQKIQEYTIPTKKPSSSGPCGKGLRPCPAEVKLRLNEHADMTKMLEQQLNTMEQEMKKLQNELTDVQCEREQLEKQRQIILCPSPCYTSTPSPCPPCPPPAQSCFTPPCPPCPQPQSRPSVSPALQQQPAMNSTSPSNPCPPPCGPPCEPCPLPCPPPCQTMNNPCVLPPPCAPPPCYSCPPCPSPCEIQLRELREQYSRLQDDYKGKLTEVAGLRTDNERYKELAIQTEAAKKLAEEKVREYDRLIKGVKGDGKAKEQVVELEQQMNVAKMRFREAQDELEELRAFVQDQQSQMCDYREKYLEAQQTVEEQKRHIDILEMDAVRINEEVNLEMQRVKNQFQEKLDELGPLPDMLKNTKIKLQEAQQMHMLAERNNDVLHRDLQLYKEKVQQITNELESLRAGNDQLQGDADGKWTDLESKYNQLLEENENLKKELDTTRELLEEKAREVQKQTYEITQLNSELENVREESARQVSRIKDRCETVRRSMQNQIYELERQLAYSKAQASAAQKDRDEVRQKMQAQISNLHENFEDAQMRIRNLQGHVNFLKDSYGAPIGFNDGDSAYSDPCNCGITY